MHRDCLTPPPSSLKPARHLPESHPGKVHSSARMLHAGAWRPAGVSPVCLSSTASATRFGEITHATKLQVEGVGWGGLLRDKTKITRLRGGRKAVATWTMRMRKVPTVSPLIPSKVRFKRCPRCLLRQLTRPPRWFERRWC